MGDFCVSGFFSRVPIKRGETAVAIICKKNKNISNIPCYLESTLIPMHIPVIGSMGDYGVFDYYDEDETTRILKGKLNMDFIKITEIILYNWNKYKKYDEQPDAVKDLFTKLDTISKARYASTEQNEYTVIYEKYSIYKAMTYDIDLMKEILHKIGTYDNIFDYNVNDRVKIEADLQDDKYHDYMPNMYTWNLLSTLPRAMGFYNNSVVNWDVFADATIEWCSFINTLALLNGTFCNSRNAGQSWHYDEQYITEGKKVLQAIMDSYDKLTSHDDEDDDTYEEDI